MRRILWFGALVAGVVLSACESTKPIHPSYKTANLFPEVIGAPGGSVSLKVVDRINNTGKLPQVASDGARAVMVVLYGPLLGAIATGKGDHYVCSTCPWDFDRPPKVLMEDMFTEALRRFGVTVAAGGEKELEVQLLRFEILNDNTLTTQGLASRILMLAVVRRNGAVIGEASILETGRMDGGIYMGKSKVEPFASETVSRAAERILVQPAIAGVLGIGAK
jgi:hypothetical protein